MGETKELAGPLAGLPLKKEDIPPWFRVDDSGRIWKTRSRSDSPDGPERRAETNTSDGYLWCYFNGSYHRAHRVVYAWTHGEAPAGAVIRHLNGDKHDNHPDNLEAGTCAENTADAIRHGTLPRGSRHGNAQLTEKSVRSMRARHSAGESYDVLAKAFGVSKSTVAWVVRGTYWRHVT